MDAGIRDAVQDDAALLAGVIRDSFRDVADRFRLTADTCPTHPSNCTEQWIETEFEKGVRYFVLDNGTRPCGCVALERAAPEICYLERLAVLPEYRRRGYGTRLVDHSLCTARDMGVRRVEIGIIAEQTDLKEWYIKRG